MSRKKTQFNTQAVASGHCDQCLKYLRFCGGRARLYSLNFSQGVIQALVNQGLAQVKNSGTGFYLELSEGK